MYIHKQANYLHYSLHPSVHACLLEYPASLLTYCTKICVTSLMKMIILRTCVSSQDNGSAECSGTAMAKMGNWLQEGMPPLCITKWTRLTQACIPSGSINWMAAVICWVKGGSVTYNGWQV